MNKPLTEDSVVASQSDKEVGKVVCNFQVIFQLIKDQNSKEKKGGFYILHVSKKTN